MDQNRSLETVMKSIGRENKMKIEIFKKENFVYAKIDGEEKQLDFNCVDSFIDAIVTKPDEDIVVSINEETLSNYKKLLDKLVEEVRSDDFKKALEEAKGEPNQH